MPDTSQLDEELSSGLKAAKGKRCYFAVVLKGGSDGALVISKQKISPVEIAAAKKKSGGSAVIQGACFGEDGKLVFEVAKLPPATLAGALKLIAKRDGGQSIQPVIRLGNSPDLQEDGQSGQTPPLSAPPAAKQSDQPTGTPQSSNEQDAQAVAAKYAEALRIWEEASAVALSAVDQLTSTLESTNDETAMAIASILEKLVADFPDTLDDALTSLADAAKAGNSGDTENYRNKSEIAIKAALAYLGNNAATIDGCEANPFGVQVKFRGPLTAALKQVLVSVKK